METHQVHPELLKRRVRVLVVGCGGNGSAVAAGLPYLHQALLAYGHPEGIHVTLLDPDVISPTNCIRQPFSQSEIGLYKSVVLANRLNLFWGLDWEGIPERLDTKRRLDGVEIVIGCVDTRTARGAIAKCAEDWSEVDYWLDLGNDADSGQFVLGEPLNRRNRRHKLRLRTVSELFPEVIEGELDQDGLPSCSAVEALDRQEPFVNPTLANHALALLGRLFRYGTVSYHGGFLSLSSFSGLAALPVDPKNWRRLRKKARHPQGHEVPTLVAVRNQDGTSTDYPPVQINRAFHPDILIMLETDSAREAWTVLKIRSGRHVWWRVRSPIARSISIFGRHKETKRSLLLPGN